MKTPRRLAPALWSACGVGALLWMGAVAAQQPADRDGSLHEQSGQEREEAGVRESVAGKLRGDQMSVHPERRLATAEGSVVFHYETFHLTCRRLTYFLDTDDLYAEGLVNLVHGAYSFQGDLAHYNLRTRKGRFLNGTLIGPAWQMSGRLVESITEDVVTVERATVSTCKLSPPHYTVASRQAHVFLDETYLHARNVVLETERLPLLYLPWLTTSPPRAPFFLVPGKEQLWGGFLLGGYHVRPPGDQDLTLSLDWRRYFGVGTGLTHHIAGPRLGQNLVKLYYNAEPNRRRPESELPKGAKADRYRLLWRHQWQPLQDTQVITNIQKNSDEDFRREFLFRDEFTKDDSEDSFISAVTTTPHYTLSALAQKRLNRFNTVNEALPQITLETTRRPLGKTSFFSDTKLDFANLQRKNAHSDDADVVRLDWFQQLSYALKTFRPLEVTPRAGVRQTFYTKDKQGGSERSHGKRNLFSGQFSAGADAGLKLFKNMPVVTDVLGLDLNSLRPVLTPTLDYDYIHEATVPNGLLNFAASRKPMHEVGIGLDCKLQTKRRPGPKEKLKAVDLARLAINLPYTFRGRGNKSGGRFGDWVLDLEATPWPWLQIETDTVLPSHFVPGTRDSRTWNLDVVFAGGRGAHAQRMSRPETFELAPDPVTALLPLGHWNVGFGHRYSHNDKTESVLQWDWRLSEKWQCGVFNRLTWKEVLEDTKHFGKFREVQFRLQRDLHDWIATVVYHVDQHAGTEMFFTLTLKAFPDLPLELGSSYTPPKSW